MNRFKYYIQLLFFLTGWMLFQSCADDDFIFKSSVLTEGETDVNMCLSFSPFAAGDLTRASLTPPGRGFNELSDLVVLVYDKEGNLLENEFGIRAIPFNQEDVTSVDRTDADASNNKTAETDTKQLNTYLRLPVGEYYVIGVANMGQNSGTEQPVTTTTYQVLTTDYASDIKTLDGLRRIKVDWKADNYRNNREMLGFFYVSDDDDIPDIPSAESVFKTVNINRPNLKLHCWLRRCASKITVDFDASELRDNINIYIRDVRIYDIASSCTLGFGQPKSPDEDKSDFNNHPKSEEELLQRPGTLSGHHIDFGEGDKFDAWPCINNRRPFIMDGDQKKDLHNQDAPALYFYENMQGKGRDRTPVPDLETGGVAEGYNKKDGKDYGTYIEVRAYYTSEVEGNSDEYEIKYRFMLGRNVTDNYDAERNHHYKLTLKFRGNANEYHWQIDYDQPEGFRVPNPWYVSYLYNHDAYLPFEFHVDPDWEIADMKAEIVTNPWYPTNGEEDDEATLTNPDHEITPTVPAGDQNASYAYLGNDVNKGNWNGFLSLRAPSEESVLTDENVGYSWGGYDTSYASTINMNYYNSNKLGERVIVSDGMVSTEGSDREKIYLKNETGNYAINMSLFTREKALVKQTGYTGNNPFVGYQRVAKIKLSATVRNRNNHSETRKVKDAYVNVVQVRRVVNPKGVYRSANNFEPFHVNLKFLSSEAPDATFRSVKSRGPWMAEVLGDNNFITLDGKQQVSGLTDSEIDFVIRFNRMGGSGNKNAIVRIKYHNYTCTHLIFVRRGYDAQTIYPTGRDHVSSSIAGGSPATTWNTFNMIAQNKMATDPRDEGSMFKFGTSGTAIDAVNNAYKDENGKEMYHDLSRDEFIPHENFITLNSNGVRNANTSTWLDIKKDDAGFTSGDMGKAATMRDFEQLYLTKYVEFGFGVLYADGATTTQSTLETVNGWHRDDTSPNKNEKGMRGVFAYYWNPEGNQEYNAKNIFFPIGRSGYGHRKNKQEELINQDDKGILRYSSNRCVPAKEYGYPYNLFQEVSPLFESLYRRPGAIYWARHKQNNVLEWNATSIGDADAYGLDLNYFTMDVNLITGVNVDYGGDACFVRTVAKSSDD